MKLALINPKYYYSSKDPNFNEIIESTTPFNTLKVPSLPLLAVAGLTPPDWEITYIDEISEGVDFNLKVDLIGISALTPQVTRAYQIAKTFRKRGIPVVLGGVHASLLPEEAQNFVDTVVIGEAENVWADLLKDFQNGNLKRIYRGSLANMQRVPIPRYDLLKPNHYLFLPDPILPMEFSRGCPINCSFCNVTSLYGFKSRLKGPQQIRNEIDYLLGHHNFSNVILKFNDPNPFVNKRGAQPILEAIKDYKLRWTSLADIGIANDASFLKIMKESGCLIIAIGLEGLVSEEMSELSEWKKRYVDKYIAAIRKINDQGIVVATNIIVSPGPYTQKAVERTIEFVEKYKILAQYSILTPYPGTPFYKKVDSQGKLNGEVEWKYFNTFNLVYDSGFSENDLYESIGQLYKVTWSKPFLRSIHYQNQKIWK